MLNYVLFIMWSPRDLPYLSRPKEGYLYEFSQKAHGNILKFPVKAYIGHSDVSEFRHLPTFPFACEGCQYVELGISLPFGQWFLQASL